MQEKRNIAFMQELQCLFALMLGTCRKFVDPSAALELLRDAFTSAEEQQVRLQKLPSFLHTALVVCFPHPTAVPSSLCPCLSADRQLVVCQCNACAGDSAVPGAGRGDAGSDSHCSGSQRSKAFSMGLSHTALQFHTATQCSSSSWVYLSGFVGAAHPKSTSWRC